VGEGREEGKGEGVGGMQSREKETTELARRGEIDFEERAASRRRPFSLNVESV